MQNLKDFCKSHNLYTWDEIPSIYRNPERDDHEKRFFERDNPNPIPSELANIKGMEVGIFWGCHTQDKGTNREYNYIDNHPAILAKYGEVVAQLSPKQRYNDKKASFFLPYFLQRKYQQLSNYKRNTATEKVEKPNYIGVFTEKKILAWFDYVKKYGEALEAAHNSNDEGNAAILQQISDFIASMPGSNVSKYGDKEERTTVTGKLFTVIFKHYKDQAYLRTEIEYKGSLSDVSRIENL